MVSNVISLGGWSCIGQRDDDEPRKQSRFTSVQNAGCLRDPLHNVVRSNANDNGNEQEHC